MLAEFGLALAAFGVVSSLILMFALVLSGRNVQVATRMAEVADSGARRVRDVSRPLRSRTAVWHCLESARC